MLANYTVDI